ncbi:MAG: aa3-type cytochrome c oxidase subunit IV [Terricaulis sp.]|nr:aa3-type cytochrome c oxidase subunit IV [Terricaulis sp.]
MAQSGARGDMDIRDQKETFDGFIATSVWTSGLIIQTVALLVLSFAIGLGWWPGFFRFCRARRRSGPHLQDAGRVLGRASGDLGASGRGRHDCARTRRHDGLIA